MAESMVKAFLFSGRVILYLFNRKTAIANNKKKYPISNICWNIQMDGTKTRVFLLTM
ncbi:MAG: hypothetical protein LRY73_12620 [Bacillus sp. (in: Bacteria)]|nr:hypothetical protein [Bacillus sp. (in: firmicutes)]